MKKIIGFTTLALGLISASLAQATQTINLTKALSGKWYVGNPADCVEANDPSSGKISSEDYYFEIAQDGKISFKTNSYTNKTCAGTPIQVSDNPIDAVLVVAPSKTSNAQVVIQSFAAVGLNAKPMHNFFDEDNGDKYDGVVYTLTQKDGALQLQIEGIRIRHADGNFTIVKDFNDYLLQGIEFSRKK